VKFAIVPPVTNPTALPAGRPSSSTTQASATSSTAECAGVNIRSPEFWSHTLTSQSTASAAGCVPPMTNPKNRPPGVAVSPGSHASASSSTTAAGSVGPSWRRRSRRPSISSAVMAGGTGRAARESSHPSAWAYARSRPAVRSIPAVSTRHDRTSSALDAAPTAPPH
jgi:hypothetical protein